MSGTEQTERDGIAAYFDLHRRHERLLAAVVGLRDTYRRSAALYGRLGPGDEPFKHAAWSNRADDLDRILAAVVSSSPATPAGECRSCGCAAHYCLNPDGSHGCPTCGCPWGPASSSPATPEGGRAHSQLAWLRTMDNDVVLGIRDTAEDGWYTDHGLYFDGQIGNVMEFAQLAPPAPSTLPAETRDGRGWRKCTKQAADGCTNWIKPGEPWMPDGAGSACGPCAASPAVSLPGEEKESEQQFRVRPGCPGGEHCICDDWQPPVVSAPSTRDVGEQR